MSVQDYLAAIRRHLIGACLIVVLVTGGALATSLTTPPTYRATAALFFSLQSGDSAGDLAQGSTFTRNQIASYAALARTPAVLTPVIAKLDLDVDARRLANRISTSTPDDTVIVEISAVDGTAERAAEIANAVSDELASVVAAVAPTDSLGRTAIRGTVVTEADVPRFQASPNTRLNVTAGLLVGLVLGLGYAFARDTLDTRVRDLRRLRALTDAPVLGQIPPAFRPLGGDGPALVVAPDSQQADLYRQLRTNVEFLRIDGRPLSLVVTSSISREGKTTVAVNLALALSEVADRVLLVDADLRHSTVAGQLGIGGDIGLSTVLVGRAELKSAVKAWGNDGLHVLPAGAAPPNPSQLLSSPRMRRLLAELPSDYDFVVIDAPAILPVTDALVLSRGVAGTVLVADSRRVRRRHLAEALLRVASVEANLLGVVMNRLTVPGSRSARYGIGRLKNFWRRLRAARSAPVPPAPAKPPVPPASRPRKPVRATGPR